ncbi:Histidine phosphatase superfamily protein [Pleurotus pulmonarius]
MIVVTFIRHGQSLDNTKHIWAGWKDVPLSDLGVQQAKALAESLQHTRFGAIYASDLLRAHQTAKSLHEGQVEPLSDIVVNPKLREQNFGIAEGNPWAFRNDFEKSLQEHYDEGIFPVLFERHEKFPGGESRDDVARRCEEAIRETVLSHLPEHGGEEGEFHVAVASHGVCIDQVSDTYAGLRNTAWTRVHVTAKGEVSAIDAESLPQLTVRVVEVNNRDHLKPLYGHAEEPPSKLDEQWRAHKAASKLAADTKRNAEA